MGVVPWGWYHGGGTMGVVPWGGTIGGVPWGWYHGVYLTTHHVCVSDRLGDLLLADVNLSPHQRHYQGQCLGTSPQALESNVRKVKVIHYFSQ